MPVFRLINRLAFHIADVADEHDGLERVDELSVYYALPPRGSVQWLTCDWVVGDAIPSLARTARAAACEFHCVKLRWVGFGDHSHSHIGISLLRSRISIGHLRRSLVLIA